MRVAVTYENGQVFQHFGHTAQFKFYDVQGGAITASRIVDTNGSGHGALAGFLAANQVDTLICGGIGGGAQAALAEAGVELCSGAEGDVDAAVEAAQNYNASITPGSEGVAVNKNGEAVAYSSADGSVLLSMRTYEEEGRDVFRDYLKKCVSSNRLTESEMQEMIDDGEPVSINCHFCNTDYTFEIDELKEIVRCSKES